MKPLILSLISGPGAGKSTTASMVFAALKEEGFNAEFVQERAKIAAWEGRHFALGHQPSLIGQQLRDYDRLEDKVEVIVTDTSPLLSLLYPSKQMQPAVVDHWRNFIAADWQSRNVLNVFLERNLERGYNPAGRSQSEEEALAIDQQILDLLGEWDVDFLKVPITRPMTGHVGVILRAFRLARFPHAAALGRVR